MARLLVFAPCERVIISEEDKTPSLIALMTTVEVVLNVIPPDEFPEGSSIPYHWYTLSFWRKEAIDEGKRYFQRIELSSDETGAVLMNIASKEPFEFTKETHREVTHVVGFPIRRQGDFTLKLFLKEATKDEWQEISAYPLIVLFRNESYPPPPRHLSA